ncbi:MAG: hypothetical protein ABDI19_10285 [Armatimonadota bacterium]
MRHENPDQWTESDWLQRLGYCACQLTHCTDDDADLAHACLHAFYNHFHRFPWQHPEPPHAWRWCCQKLYSLWLDEKRHAQRYPQLSLDELPEGVAMVELTAQVQADVDGEAFLAALPKSLREPLQLLLQGYSWEEVARLLGKKSSTLRGYLPELRKRFVAFFGYDPSNRVSESLIDMEGATNPSDEAANGGEDDASDRGKEQGFSDDTGSAGGGVNTSRLGTVCAAIYAGCAPC